MSGYRRVNFYELCRLCTSSEGDKTHIFRDEGRRRQLPTKIQSCLPLQILEEDSLPKTVCNMCVDKIEEFSSFRQSAVNAEAMLETYFNSLRCSDEYRRSEGKVSNVYVKDSHLDMEEDIQELSPQDETPQPPQQQQNHPVSNVSHKLVKNHQVDSVIQVLKTDHITHHQSSVVTSVAAVSSRPVINLVDSQTAGTKTITLPINVSQQSPLKLGGGNAMVLPVSMEGLQSLVQAGASVQILQQTEADGSTRLQSYRYVQIPSSQEGGATVALVPAEPRIHFVDQSQVRASSVSSMPEDEQHEEITVVHPQETEEEEEEEENSEMHYVQFSGYAKDQREDRSTISNISEFLKIKGGNILPEEAPNQNDSELPENSVAMCGNCGKMLMSNDEMTEHIASCNNNGVLVSSNNQDIKGIKGEPESDGQDPNNLPLNYPCDICNKAFRRKEHLLQHKKLHTGERPFVCGTCGKSFSRKEHLLRHGTSHTGQKTYPCDICSKMFSRKDNLHKHRKTHGINGPYVCEFCGKSFVVKHYYMMHVSNHNCAESKQALEKSGENPPQHMHRCDICLKTFVSEEFLKNHKSRHRNRKNVQVIQLNKQGNVGADENQRQNTGHQQQQQQQQQQAVQQTRHIRLTRDQVIMERIESQDTNTLVLKQEIDMVDEVGENEDPDPLDTTKLHLSSLGTATLIPTTLGTHVIQLPSNYIHTGDTHIETEDGLMEIMPHPQGRKTTT